MTNEQLRFATEHTRAQIPRHTALENDFPAALLSELAQKESWRKEVHRPATSTHKWWAKRLGSVFRGILTSAVAEGHEEAVDLYSSRTRLDGLIVLDPFAGSGVTGVEALKLGARAICFDINPVATLVQRQAMQRWDADTLNTAYRSVEFACREEIDRVHRTQDGRTVLYYFWVAVSSCGECGEAINLFDSPVYSRNAYPKRVPKAQIVCPSCLDVQEDRYDFNSLQCANGHEITPHGPVSRSSMRCSSGHSTNILASLKDKRPNYRMYSKLVLGHHGEKTYEPVNHWDRQLYAECETLAQNMPATAVRPDGKLHHGNNTNQALRWNFRTWSDFFNWRQLYSLSLLATAVRDVATGNTEREALCALFSGTLEFNNLFTSFKGEGTGAVRHMFSHHILKPERTPLEAHPWGTPQSSGSFSTLFKSRLLRASEYKADPIDLVRTTEGVQRRAGLSSSIDGPIFDSWQEFTRHQDGAYIATTNSASTDVPDEAVDLIITDPPYMDNVHYSELADFFHAWLKGIKPYSQYSCEETTRKIGEVQDADPEKFGASIQAVWTECCRTLKPRGLLAFTFHQARLEGWVELVQSLQSAGLTITAIQPVKGEMTTSIVKAGAKEPSNLDSIVVCRKSSALTDRQALTSNEVYSAAIARLRSLIGQGVDVGSGDIRSVIRGSMLAQFLAVDADPSLDVDSFADRAISELLGERTPQQTDTEPLRAQQLPLPAHTDVEPLVERSQAN